ncbi:Endoribonuclease L-PSP/chorismate mutase-like protein [Aspergillus pseudocaelatus]|uniref:Endoribonuclease L-PSP/chorismate mutase-like protein n=1 Tax=Aspergillus pseudocaelatus TaxID=1825620 RepID=A0ABQ6X101_9EURO|nr:Endoribonuclease L-PSP/chorismate mutase-like protein [Aspergillus pseudocaelatus]
MSIPRAIHTTKAPTPPTFLSQAIRFGNIIFCSGQIGCDPETGLLVEGPVQERTKQILSNINSILLAGGSSLENIVKCNIYLTNMGDFGPMNEVYTTFFSDPMPARTCVCVKELPLGTDVEIECIAAVKGDQKERLLSAVI